MRGAKGEAVLLVLRALWNEADAAGSVRPEGKNAGLGFLSLHEKSGVFMNSQISNFRSSVALLPSVVLMTTTVSV